MRLLVSHGTGEVSRDGMKSFTERKIRSVGSACMAPGCTPNPIGGGGGKTIIYPHIDMHVFASPNYITSDYNN